LQWVKKKWQRQPALVRKDGKAVQLYTGQDYDPKYYDLVQDAWEHDHCGICWKVICDCGSPEHTDKGYFPDFNWLCEECFEKHINK
jgi:hypothetical protein